MSKKLETHHWCEYYVLVWHTQCMNNKNSSSWKRWIDISSNIKTHLLFIHYKFLFFEKNGHLGMTHSLTPSHDPSTFHTSCFYEIFVITNHSPSISIYLHLSLLGLALIGHCVNLLIDHLLITHIVVLDGFQRFGIQLIHQRYGSGNVQRYNVLLTHIV